MQLPVPITLSDCNIIVDRAMKLSLIYCCLKSSLWNLLGILTVLWVVFLIVLFKQTPVVPQSTDPTGPSHRQPSGIRDDYLQLKLQFDKLSQENKQLKILTRQLSAVTNESTVVGAVVVSPVPIPVATGKPDSSPLDSIQLPSGLSLLRSGEYEKLRRKLDEDVTSFWWLINSEVSELQRQAKLGSLPQEALGDFLERAKEHNRVIRDGFTRLGGLNAAWRQGVADRLSDVIQRRLFALQNPPDCVNARKLVCSVNKACGLGCQIHHLVYCLMVALGTQRTLVLESASWRYTKRGWDSVFAPLSASCVSVAGSYNRRPWGSHRSMRHAQVVELPIVDAINNRPDYLPLAIPGEFAEVLSAIHGDPPIWWLGQLVRYIMRYSNATRSAIREMSSDIGFANPIVGVHVRRTDKVGTEASFHDVSEYMRHVDDWYYQLELRENVTERRVYLATDDPNLLADARNRFPRYRFLGDPDFARTASLGSRFTEASLHGIVLDLFFLGQCDYLVCTFSSQVCRLAYEVMQTRNVDGYASYRSLDDIFYFGGQQSHDLRAIWAHKARRAGELDIEIGDKLHIAGNHWNGYSKADNLRTGRTGVFPSYKAEEILLTGKFPTFDGV